jgi:nitrite reductase/ring-hydroxylating ferredoxin subunit
MIATTEDGAVVIARVGDAHYCVDATCPTHGSIMHGGVLKHVSWICPLGPGCIYDVRNGSRLGGGPALGTHPVRLTESGGLQIGFGIPYEPKLPAF